MKHKKYIKNYLMGFQILGRNTILYFYLLNRGNEMIQNLEFSIKNYNLIFNF